MGDIYVKRINEISRLRRIIIIIGYCCFFVFHCCTFLCTIKTQLFGYDLNNITI